MAGQYTIPYVVEQRPTGERASDVYSRLLSDRIVFLGTEIDDGVANVVIAQLLHLQSESSELPIHVYVNSPGGSITALLAVYDTMQYVRPPVATFCLGQAASAAAVLLAAGTPGQRHVLEHARVLLHQPSGGAEGTAADLEIQAAEILRLRGQVEQILSRHTGQSVERLRQDTDRDRILRRVEPGVRRGGGRARRRDLPRPAVHDARPDAAQPREAVPLRRRPRPLERPRPVRARGHARHQLGRRPDPGPHRAAERLLRRQARRPGAADQQQARAGQAPAPDPRRVRRRAQHRGQAARHRRARSRPRDAHRRRRGRPAHRRGRARRDRRGRHDRRGDDRVAGAAAGRRPPRRPRPPRPGRQARPDHAERRLLPGRRPARRQDGRRAADRRGRRARRPHVGLACRPRRRGLHRGRQRRHRPLAHQHRAHRRGRQRRRRHRDRPVRRALPAAQHDLERRARTRRALPERAAVRPADAGRLDRARRHARLGRVQGR
ncbi:ATP-dependent Clp protease proteolytic subunit [Cellulomonas fimi]|nr:ATP-dependent Clp protease proteolytic subunit [Cellulomonas fimi]